MSNQTRPTRNEARTAAREKARQQREAQKKRDKRNKFLIRGGSVIAAVVVIALIVWGVASANKPEGPGPKNMASDGVLFTGGGGKSVVTETAGLKPGAKPKANPQDTSGNVANIVVYLDYLCPYCGMFERTNSDYLQKLVDQGAATLETHPLATLINSSSGTQYSLRAANAAACVVDSKPDAFWKFSSLLFENQPEEGTSGLTDDQLKSYAKDAGATEVSSCIDENKFKPFILAATNRALKEPVPNSSLEKIRSTPTVLVNGQKYQGKPDDASAFQLFVTQAASQSFTKSSSETPTPTPAQ